MIKIKLGNVDFEINQTEIGISKQSNPKTYVLANGGEVIKPCTDKLDIISFSGCFYDLSNYNSIINMLKGGNPQNLIIAGMNIPINMFVVVEKFDTFERGGDIQCIEYSIRLKEYVSQRIKIINSSTNVSSDNIQIETPQTVYVPHVYIVKKGDTLWSIANKYLGNGRKYHELAKINNIQNPNLIHVGQEIRIK